MATALRQIDAHTFSNQDQAAFIEASQSLSRLPDRMSVRVEAADGESKQTFVLPAGAVRVLTEMLMHLGRGRRVMVMQPDHELTTQEAADMLNVSRPYLIKLLDGGKIAFHKTGTHRRIRLDALDTYRQDKDDRSRKALEELAAEAQELSLGY